MEVAADVFRELFDRSVAPLWLLTHRFQNDVVQIALEFPAQPMGLRASYLADCLWCDPAIPARAGGRFSSADRSTGLRSQSGKALTVAQATVLINLASQVQAALGCQ